MAGRNVENDSPMIFLSKAPAAGSCKSSCRSAVCISCSKLAVAYKEGSTVSLNPLLPFTLYVQGWM